MKTTGLSAEMSVQENAHGGEKWMNTYRECLIYFSGKYLVVYIVQNQHFLSYAAAFLGTQCLSDKLLKKAFQKESFLGSN